MDKPHAKYAVIHEIMSQEGNLQNVRFARQTLIAG